MSTSETSICNRALAAMGSRSTIASLTEASNEAEACSLIYGPVRDQVLNMAFWNFAKKTDSLALLKSAPGTPSNPTGATQWSSLYPAPPWLYEYAYPADCLQMRMLIPQIDTGVIGTPIFSSASGMYPFLTGPVSMFEVASDVISGAQANVVLTNQYQAIGQYTALVSNPLLFSAQFEEALVQAMAAKLAIALSGDKTLANMLYKSANQQIIQARQSDGNEGITVIDPQASWINARENGLDSSNGFWVAPYNPLFSVW